MAFELDQKYLAASTFRFLTAVDENTLVSLYDQLCAKAATGIVLPQQYQEEIDLK